MRKLHEIAKMVQLKEGNAIALPNKKRRNTTLYVNTSHPTMLTLKDPVTGSLQFLANVDGYDVLEFVVDGATEIHPSTEGEFWFYTPESEFTHTAIDEAVSFTVPMERDARNPSVEKIIAMQTKAMERRIAFMVNAAVAERTKPARVGPTISGKSPKEEEKEEEPPKEEKKKEPKAPKEPAPKEE